MVDRRIANRLAQRPEWTAELARRIGGATAFVAPKE
jgi:hypothetical protein